MSATASTSKTKRLQVKNFLLSEVKKRGGIYDTMTDLGLCGCMVTLLPGTDKRALTYITYVLQ